jgi:nitroreductase
MDVHVALRKRRSIRAFLDKPVSNELIINILESAKYSPSGSNI